MVWFMMLACAPNEGAENELLTELCATRHQYSYEEIEYRADGQWLHAKFFNDLGEHYASGDYAYKGPED